MAPVINNWVDHAGPPTPVIHEGFFLKIDGGLGGDGTSPPTLAFFECFGSQTGWHQ
jgi:hypothetical protein